MATAFTSLGGGVCIHTSNDSMWIDTTPARSIFLLSKNHLQQLSASERELMKEEVLLMKLNLVLPAINATSERAFSAMRRVKSYLRSTMTQGRLDHLMILHGHKELTDKSSLADVASDCQ